MDVSFIMDFSSRLVAIQQGLADRAPDRPAVVRSIPGLRLAINAQKVTPFPSSNPNRAEIVADAPRIEAGFATACVEHYAAAGVDRFFFWLSPSANAERARSELSACGLRPFGGARYPVLIREAREISPSACALDVRRFDLQRHRVALQQFAMDDARARILAGVRDERDEHFVAWDGDVPVGVASLTCDHGIGYLWGAGTLPAYRGRGAQTALIALRINRAVERGCTLVASETLTVLKTSLGNLQRAGFGLAFFKEVFDSKPGAPAP